MAFERLDGPLGPARGDYQAALTAAVIANANRGKNRKKFGLKHFLLRWGSDHQRPGSANEWLGILRTLNRKFGGSEKKEGGAE